MTKDEDFEIEKNRSHYKKRRNYQSNSAAHFNVSRQNIHPRRQHQRYYNVCTTYLVIKSAKCFFFFQLSCHQVGICKLQEGPVAF
jgi:hypothetical protein